MLPLTYKTYLYIYGALFSCMQAPPARNTPTISGRLWLLILCSWGSRGVKSGLLIGREPVKNWQIFLVRRAALLTLVLHWVRSDEGPIPGLAPEPAGSDQKKCRLNATWLRLRSQFGEPTSKNLAPQICGASPTSGPAGCHSGLGSTGNCCLNATDLGPRILA